MGVKRAFINGFNEFREQIIDWSDDTIRRRIKADGFPAIKATRGYIFDRKEVELWFKRRVSKAV